MAAKFEIIKDRRGEYRFHAKAGNGEIIATSEGYKTKVISPLLVLDQPRCSPRRLRAQHGSAWVVDLWKGYGTQFEADRDKG